MKAAVWQRVSKFISIHGLSGRMSYTCGPLQGLMQHHSITVVIKICYSIIMLFMASAHSAAVSLAQTRSSPDSRVC